MQYKLTKEAWESIGELHSWLKVAEELPDMPDAPRVGMPIGAVQENQENVAPDPMEQWYESLANLRVITFKESEDTDTASHVERSPGSSWGGKEVYDGESIIKSYNAILTGDVFLPPNILASDLASENLTKQVEKILEEEIKKYGRENIIPDIEREIEDLYDAEEGSELKVLNVDIQALTPKASNLYTVTFVLEYETVGFLSEYELKSRGDDARADDMRDENF